MDNEMNYAKIVAIAKKLILEYGGGSGGGGGAVQEELDAHIVDNKRHLTSADREILIKANQYKGYYEDIASIPQSGVEGDYILVGETNSFWIYDKEQNSYMDLSELIAYDDSEIKNEIIKLKQDIENSSMEAISNTELEEILQ